MRILLRHGADVRLRNADGWTALHVAVRANCAEHMHALLDHGADVWRTASHNGRTPLHTAALDRCDQAVDILLR